MVGVVGVGGMAHSTAAAVAVAPPTNTDYHRRTLHRHPKRRKHPTDKMGSQGQIDFNRKLANLVALTQAALQSSVQSATSNTINGTATITHTEPIEPATGPIDVETLVQEWSRTLKHVPGGWQRLLPLVELVDQLVRYNHHHLLLFRHGSQDINDNDPSSSATALHPFRASSDELMAVNVGISAWSRIAGDYPDAAPRAQQLFELLPKTHVMPTDVRKNFVRQRRNVYDSLLLVWSRSTLPNLDGDPDAAIPAAESCRYWLEQMKLEEKQYALHYRLIDTPCYNRVIGAYATLGQINEVEQLVQELRSRDLNPDSVTYDLWIKAYQVVLHARRNLDRSAARDLVRRAQDIFQMQLESYRSLPIKQVRHHHNKNKSTQSMTKPLPLTLGRVISMLYHQSHKDLEGPDRVRAILTQALSFEEEHPECAGLVDTRSFCRLLQAYVGKGRIDEADQLLAMLLRVHQHTSHRHLRPSAVAFGIVLAGYGRLRDPTCLGKIEALVQQAEDLFVEERKNPTTEDLCLPDQLTCGVYNCLLSSYVRHWPSDAVSKMQTTLARMERLAQEYQSPNLLPDSISYTVLMHAIVKQGDSGYLHELYKVLKWMQSAPWESARPHVKTYSLVLNALAKSADPTALTKIQEILHTMGAPDTTCYNVALNAYAKRCLPDEALFLLDKMKSDFRSGRNSHCRPDNISYSSVFHALSSNLPRCCSANQKQLRWTKALECFDDMIESYLQGDESCRPSAETISTLLHLLRSNIAVRDKHVAARMVLERLERLQLAQGTTTALAFIQACGDTTGSTESRRESLSFALDILKSLGAQANSEIFRAILDACDRLMDPGDDKTQLITAVFQICAKAGQANWKVLDILHQICPPDLYSTLTSPDAQNMLDVASIPEA